MHLVEKLSSMLRLDPAKVEPYLELYPIPLAEYITIYNECSVQANNYEYFADVIRYIRKFTVTPIVQILNSSNDARLPDCLYVEKYSYGQLFYILKNSSLHICTDAFTNEASGLIGTNVINVIGNRPANTFYPFWARKHSAVAVSPETSRKPSFSITETPKMLNLIAPEVLANQILASLKIRTRISEKTIFTGKNYASQYLDFIPNFDGSTINAEKSNCTVRFDLGGEEKFIHGFCRANKHTLVTKTALSDETYKIIKPNNTEIIFIVDENTDPSICDSALNCGLSVKVKYYETPNENVIKFNFFDFRPEPIKYEVPKIEEDFSFYSSKRVLSNGRVFSSTFHATNDLPTGIITKGSSDPALWVDSDFFRIVTEEKNVRKTRARKS